MQLLPQLLWTVHPPAVRQKVPQHLGYHCQTLSAPQHLSPPIPEQQLHKEAAIQSDVKQNEM